MKTLTERIDFYGKYMNFHNFSKAQTIKGVLKAINTNKKCEFVKKMIKKGLKTSFIFQRPNLCEEEKNIQHAIHQKSFRKNFVRKLQKEAEKILVLPKYDLNEFMEFGNNFYFMIKRLNNINYILKTLNSKKVFEFSSDVGIIPLHHCDIEKVKKLGYKGNFRGNRALISSIMKKSYLHHEDSVTFWKYGRPRTEQNAVNNNYIQCFGIIRNKHQMDYIFHNKMFQITLPEKYQFSSDTHGLKIVQGRHDYHFFLNDLQDFEYMEYHFQRNKEKRLKMEAEEKVFEAECQNVMVCVKDSFIAGNCQVGTESFIAKHNLDVHKHYTPKELLNIAGSDYRRVKLTIMAAIQRTANEVKQGYSLLKDHVYNN